MTELGPNARALIELARHEDDPQLAARERLQQALLIRLNTGVIAAEKSGGVEFAQRSGLRSHAAKSLVGAKSVLGLAVVVAAIGAGQMLSSRNIPGVGTVAPRAASVAVVTPPADAPNRREQPPLGPTLSTPGRRGVDASSFTRDAPRVSGERGASTAQGSKASEKPEQSPLTASEPLERTPSRRESSRAITTGQSASETASTAKFDDVAVASPSPSPSPSKDAKPAAPPAEELLAEARALREVQQVLRAGHSAQALSLLAAQERQFARGQLGEARAAARAMALCANPSTEGRRSALGAFEARWPRSILLSSVRAACASSKE